MGLFPEICSQAFWKLFSSCTSRISTLIMSDVEGDDAPSAAVAVSGAMDVNQAIQEVLKDSMICDGLARGLRETRTVTRKTTRSWSRPFAWSTRFLSLRSTTTRSWESGLVFARSTRRAQPERSSDAPPSSSRTSVGNPKPRKSWRSTSRNSAATKRGGFFYNVSYCCFFFQSSLEIQVLFETVK